MDRLLHDFSNKPNCAFAIIFFNALFSSSESLFLLVEFYNSDTMSSYATLCTYDGSLYDIITLLHLGSFINMFF
ncbi:MAG: hypothetical protein ACKPKO_26190 [Candidatus Fonsibacter sp.]